jgi:hypothetical protein
MRMASGDVEEDEIGTMVVRVVPEQGGSRPRDVIKREKNVRRKSSERARKTK